MTRPRVQVRLATKTEFAQANGPLPFNRLDRVGLCLWLIAWDREAPVGHARVALDDEPPELQNVWVTPERRREGIAGVLALAAEQEARARGHDRLRLTVSATNPQARAVWERLGYRPTDEPPERMQQPIALRKRELEIGDTLLALEKLLPRI